MKRIYFAALVGLFGCVSALSAQGRSELLLEKNWKFTREDNNEFIKPAFDDSKWQSVTVPHDWAIYGPFSSLNDKQEVAISQDGQKEAMEHAGRTGGLPFVGVGWYRTEFDVPQFQAGKRATILFDGAMSHANVYINGQKVGYWPYGYNSFYFDITKYLKPGEKNTLAVRLENLPESSRWYPGAGLYRNVHLIITEDAYIPVWGTYITTPSVNEKFAKVNVRTKVVLPEGADPAKYSVETSVWNPNKQKLTAVRTSLAQMKYNNDLAEQEFVIQDPSLWSPEMPALYSAETRLYEGDKLKDTYTTPFGIRSIEIIPDKGFFLNGKRTVFKGVCNHHDLGPLGAAVNDAAIRRQIRILKDMGCNAIRTSHNMPAPELIRACDEMGMMIMAESFDEWNVAKCKNGYNLLFDEWAEKDLVNLLHNFRNNPSVVMWCIGNEVPNQWNEGDCKIAKWLQDICHREDPTRPVTCGMDQVTCVLANGFAAMIDILGLNYRTQRYKESYDQLPQNLILGSETASTVSSRGVYKFPVEDKKGAKYEDHQCSSYDVEVCPWSNIPDEDFALADDHHWTIGQFVWTGFDYLGEPSPYDTDSWPNHSSMFGIIDLASLPKDRYYLYRSVWNKEAETLHILPHWTWPGREGEVTPIFVYTNYPTAELFINGKSYGKQSKNNSSLKNRYRLMWMDTKYEPGEVKVVAYDKNGKAVAEKVVRTAGKPHHIELVSNRNELTADGKDLAYVTVKVVDKDGNLCPADNRQINFSVKGTGKYRAAANGDPTNLEQFHLPKMHAFNGMLTAILQAGETAGEIVFTAKANGVKAGNIRIQTK